MKLKNVKAVLIVIMALLCFASTFSVVSMAAEDAFGYSFKVKAKMKKSYANDSRQRTTGRTDNPWKVELSYTGEGKGSMNYFFIAKTWNKDECSRMYGVAQGTGPHYYRALENAQNQYVTLGARNNNNNEDTFTISGYWDEEIGRILPDLPA